MVARYMKRKKLCPPKSCLTSQFAADNLTCEAKLTQVTQYPSTDLFLMWLPRHWAPFLCSSTSLRYISMRLSLLSTSFSPMACQVILESVTLLPACEPSCRRYTLFHHASWRTVSAPKTTGRSPPSCCSGIRPSKVPKHAPKPVFSEGQEGEEISYVIRILNTANRIMLYKKIFVLLPHFSSFAWTRNSKYTEGCCQFSKRIFRINNDITRVG